MGLRDQSKGVTSKENHQDLVDSSPLKLDDKDLFENDSYEAEFSSHVKTVAGLSLGVEELIAEISQVFTVNSCNSITEKSTRRKYNLLLESILISKETRNIGDTTNQRLEPDEKQIQLNF